MYPAKTIKHDRARGSYRSVKHGRYVGRIAMRRMDCSRGALVFSTSRVRHAHRVFGLLTDCH
ncbi:hypothetical protein ACO0LL_25950 [Undibacterium sp. TC4M20W]|uniref:hypothetical protein n=1 Tax=Undibacterium sp. TC4M20W TaxID=3413052 RepID=UPI003BF24CDB